MKVEIEISDKAIDAHIDDISDCSGVILTPKQFIDVCKLINWNIGGLTDYGFCDTMDREAFIESFITKVLNRKKIPTYGEQREQDIDMEKYWKELIEKALSLGYVVRNA